MTHDGHEKEAGNKEGMIRRQLLFPRYLSVSLMLSSHTHTLSVSVLDCSTCSRVTGHGRPPIQCMYQDGKWIDARRDAEEGEVEADHVS